MSQILDLEKCHHSSSTVASVVNDRLYNAVGVTGGFVPTETCYHVGLELSVDGVVS